MQIEEKNKEVEDGVKKPVDTPAQEKEVTSPEVKVEPKKVDDAENARLKEQVENLNAALKSEREEKKEKFKQFEDEINALRENQKPFDVIKNAFAPQPPDPDVPEEKDFESEFEKFWEKKESERRQDQERESRRALIKQEVDALTAEYDGTDGKPKYNDDEVLKWQEKNGKIYLTPKEAFREMKYNELMEYEISKRAKSTPAPTNQEVPSGTPSERQPKEFKIESKSDTRAAVLEAIELAEANLDN